MQYEYLIRRAHQTGRYGTKGADADIFRSFLRQHWEYKSETDVNTTKPSTSAKNIEKIEKAFRKEADEVKGYISRAIAQVLKKYPHKFDDAQQNELLSCTRDLNTYDVEIIKQVIKRADDIIRSIGLFPK